MNTLQRDEPPHSVLATGTWYKLAITREGIYKIDRSLLSSMGISDPATNIRLYGTGGRMLPEPVSTPRYDDLPEVATTTSGTDLLFYAPGPHSPNTINLYSDTAWYFLQVSSGGKRISTDPAQPAPTTTIQSFDYQDRYENDSLNLLQSGKQWWGPAFTSLQTTRTIPFTLPSTPSSLSIETRVGARSGGTSIFNISVNGVNAGALNLPAITGNFFEAFATTTTSTLSVTPSGTNVPVTLSFLAGGSGATGWLDYITLRARCPLQLPATSPLFFRDAVSLGSGTAGFQLGNASAQTQVWDVTDPITPVQLTTSLTGSTLSFSRDANTLHEYVAFENKGLLTPTYIGRVANQDLHGITGANMLIITTPAFAAAAQRLASWHTTHDGLSTQVIDVSQVYTEFGGGSPDPTAIRDFIKMCYDRGGLQYVLLMGDASYDYKRRIPNNTNFVPTWQSTISIDPIYSYPSDDYYGFLSPGDDINSSTPAQLMVAIGRLPVKTATEADAVVSKILGYHDAASFGRWQQHITFVADDGDNNLHLQDAESMSTLTTQQYPAGRISKIYLDAYDKVSDAGGSRYPTVNKAIAEDIYNGTLIWNYTGHGNYTRLADEVVLDATSLASWKNKGKLPLFITATCDFAPFDNPAYTSIGEQVLLQENGGGIALMTTTRAVFAASNKVMNANYLAKLLTPGIDGRMPTLGTAAMEAKNLTYNTYSDIPNNRKFQLLGDPALTLAFPQYRVVTDSLLDEEGNVADTIKAMGRYTFKAHIEDARGNRAATYNGQVITTIYDKPAVEYTLGNAAGSTQTSYYQQQHVLFSGKQSVKNGNISGTFIVPLDIDYHPGAGSISYFATDSATTAGGSYSSFQVTGTATGAEVDAKGPDITAWLNDKGFTNGDITSENPVLYLQLYDIHGINTTGSGIGHDLVATLDEDNDQYYVLNNFFEASLDSYQAGTVTYPFYGLSAGEHTLSIRAWDTYNNSSSYKLRFKVVPSSQPLIQNAGCYPNPFHEQTSFTFEHNQQGQELDLTIRIFTVGGQQIKTIRQTINAAGSRYLGANWDGRNDAGTKMPPGIYFYNILVNAGGKARILGGKVILY